MESFGELEEILLFDASVFSDKHQPLPAAFAEILDRVGDQLVRNQALKDGSQVTGQVHAALDANNLVEVPKVWKLISLVSLRKGEW